MPELRVARSELILGTAPDGKMARAEALAQAWVVASRSHRAVYVDTAQAWDAQMCALIARHRVEPGAHAGARRMSTVQEPTEVAHALGAHSRPDTLIVVDCLTFWLTATLMHAMAPDESDAWSDRPRDRPRDRPIVRLADAMRACAGPLVLISHHLQPADASRPHDLATLLDTLDSLDQQAAQACERVTLMAAGEALTLRGIA